MFLDSTPFANSPALESYAGTTVTYGQLDLMASCVRDVMGPDKCCVLILADKSIDAVSMYYCCLTNGYVPLVMDEKTDCTLLESLEKDYNFQYIFCHKSKLAYFNGGLIYATDNDYVILSTGKERMEINPDLAVLMSTSGTTGSSKTVRLTYSNLRVACEASAQFYEADKTDIGMMLLPMAYCFGQVFLIVHFLKGAKICVCNYSIFENEFWDFFNRSQITDFYCVPYTGSQLRRLGFYEQDYPALRYICQGGGKADIAVATSFLNGPLSEHVRFYNIYGQTEAVMISSLPWRLLSEKVESVGVGLPNISVYIKDSADIGEIVVSGGNICLGYAYTSNDLARGDDKHGILFTGDIGQFDNDGCLYILGRESRFSKIAGLRISHDEIERIVKKKYPTVDVACVGNDAVISVIFSGESDENDMLKYICSTIHVDKNFLRIYHQHELPLLINGKVDYHSLMARFIKGG